MKSLKGDVNTQKIVYIFAAALLVLPLLSAQLPPALQKIQDYNNQVALEFVASVSIFIAFLAGMTSIFSPCILPLLPAYFAITFKERKRLTMATLLFFAGFTAVFLLMGVLAAATGEAFVMVFGSFDGLIPLAGLVLIVLGILLMLGIGWAGPQVQKQRHSGPFGVVLSGAAFAIGWSACVGPILSGVIIMVSALSNYGLAIILMLAYSLGIFVPLFFLSFFFGRLHLDRAKWINKPIVYRLAGKKFSTSLPHLIAAAIFLFLGIVFIVAKGTAGINDFDMFGYREKFYSLQDAFLADAARYNLIGALAMLFVVATIVLMLWMERKKHQSKSR